MILLKLLSRSNWGIILAAFCFINYSPGMTLANTESVGWVDAKVLSDAVRVVEEIDVMRSKLAKSIDPEEIKVDQETFAMVCKPVGMQAKKIAQKKGWKFRQLAMKYRNPKNKADHQGIKAMEKFKGEPELQGFWTIESKLGKKGFRYFKRITVEPACLNCHGKKENRPDFIKSKYPDDRAFGFSSGDLRGVYSISFLEK